jgi:hypothetical protein
MKDFTCCSKIELVYLLLIHNFIIWILLSLKGYNELWNLKWWMLQFVTDLNSKEPI